MKHVSREELETYLKNVGKRGLNTFSTLGKLQPFVDLMESDLGFALLGEQVNRYETLLEKISNLAANDEEKVEFKVIKNFLINISTKLAQYNTCVADIKKPR
jgi:hypothetical protein